MIDPKIFEDARRRVDAVVTCEDLQDAALAAISATGVQAKINEELAKLQPMLALLEAPEASLPKIVTWITDYISAVLTPYLAPVALYAAELAVIAGEATSLVSAIEQKAAAIGSCTVTLPSAPGLPS